MIIYLDFDGVLHPDAVFNPKHKPLELRAPGELFMHAHVLIDALAYYPEAQIVLSTSWVRVLGYERTLSKMPFKLAERVKGATWQKHMDLNGQDPFNSLSRFQQIEMHVKSNEIKSWLAIDDLHSGSECWPDELKHKLVLTEQSTGLGCNIAKVELTTKLLEIQYD